MTTLARSVWDDEAGPPCPALADTITADVCVVGLGGAGLAALDELASRGVNAAGIDAAEIGGGATGRNAGFLLGGLADFYHDSVRRFGDAAASQIYRHTLDEIQRMAADYPGHVKLGGSLRVAASSDEVRDCEEHLQALNAHGFAAERYAGPEGVGLLLPNDGTFHPQRCVRAAAERLMARGVRLFTRTPAMALSPTGVTTRHGRIDCPTVIVAIDGRLETLLPELKPRVRTARLQMLATAPARDAAFPRPVYRREGYDYWQQLPGGEIALGGFRDRGGEAEWTTEASPGGTVQTLLEQFLRIHLRTAAPITHRWAACVAYTADGLPILEEVRPQVFVTGAYSGTGNIASRLGGRAAAHLACGVRSNWAGLLRAAAASATPVAPAAPSGRRK